MALAGGESSTKPAPETGPWTSKILLSLDGGGIRGYSSLLILQSLMKEIKASEDALEKRKSESTWLHGRPGTARSVPLGTRVRTTPIAQRAIYEPSTSGRLQDEEILAFPDTGAAANFISLQYVRSRGLAVDLDTAKSHVRTGAGSLVSILGTVTLPFSFRGEREKHELEFNVIRNAVHDVVLGSPFLSLTETFTRHFHRIKQKLRDSCRPRICLLGSQQYVRGSANGIHVDAVPDTGADVSVMSAAFARQHGFVVNTADEHRISLVFADGSTATTIGLVEDVEWNYESSRDSYRLGVYVLEELQTDLILDYTFLFDTDAFVVYEDDFWVEDDDTSDGRSSWLISIIKLVGRTLHGSRWKQTGSSSPASTPTDDPESLWQLEKSDRLNAYRLARKQAQGMPEDQKRSFLEPHLAQWDQFLQSRPGRASTSQSSLSQVASSTSSPAGVPVSNVTSAAATTRKTSFFSKLRDLKSKASSATGNSPVAP